MQRQPHVDQIDPRARSPGCVSEREVSNATSFTSPARCAIKPGGRPPAPRRTDLISGSGGERAAEQLWRVTGGRVLVLCAGVPVQMFRGDIPLVYAETGEKKRVTAAALSCTFYEHLQMSSQ